MNILVTDQTNKVQASARPLVRLVVAGHVDHGKSTLIGRLLHETDGLPEGKLEALRAISARRGMGFEWSFAIDALQAERDQGITIDTSQIRLRTPSRDVVLIDAPGHVEFLRNMITGASQADAALLVVDGAEGMRDQTRRHGHMLQLLGLKQIIVVVNKMDRIDYDEAKFRAIEAETSDYLGNLGIAPDVVIPISARHGDEVAQRGDHMTWYRGPTLLEAIDTLSTARPSSTLSLRLPVQAIYKFDDARIIAGRVETGRIRTGDEIMVLPSGKTAQVRSIEAWPVPDESQPPQEASAGRSVGITLDRELFIERGNVIALAAAPAQVAQQLRARIFWLGREPLAVGANINVRIGTAEARGVVEAIEKAIDPAHILSDRGAAIAHNHVGEVVLGLSRPLAADTHDVNPRLGRVVLESSGRIVGGGVVLAGLQDASAQPAARASEENIVPVESTVSAAERSARHGQQGAVIWLTGLPGAGKSTLARALERRLFDRGNIAVLLDGDTLRTGLNSDLGFAPADRAENIRRLAEVSSNLARSGLIAIVAAVSPTIEDRARARTIAGERFYEIHVAASLDVCESRDPKGHYRRARAGEIKGFTGVDSPYEPPVSAELTIDTGVAGVDEAVDTLERFLGRSGVLANAEETEAVSGSIAKRFWPAAMRASESRRRSIVKALSWRAAGSLDTFVLTLVITSSMAFAGSIAVIETVTKIALYYVHERIWSFIPWGRR